MNVEEELKDGLCPLDNERVTAEEVWPDGHTSATVVQLQLTPNFAVGILDAQSSLNLSQELRISHVDQPKQTNKHTVKSCQKTCTTYIILS